MIATILDILLWIVLVFIYGGSSLILWGMLKEQQPKWRRKRALKNLEKALHLEILDEGDRVLLVTKNERVWDPPGITNATDILSDAFAKTDIKFLIIDGADWNVTVLRERK